MRLPPSASNCHAVILAGGRGLRFWPRSRRVRPKQLLAPAGGPSLVRATAERLLAVVPPERLWVVTGAALRSSIAAELPEVALERIIAEPVQRNTAPAISLATQLVLREDPEAVLGVFPADHYIARTAAYRSLLQRALEAASGDRLIVVGVRPRWPETGYGYIEFPVGTRPGTPEPLPVAGFREKPDLETARAFVAAGRYYWNSGQFFWKASVFAAEAQRRLPEAWKVLTDIADQPPTRFEAKLRERYGRCEDVSVDRAVLEGCDRLAGFAAPEFGWSDLGSWEAVYRLLPQDAAGNCARTSATFLRAEGNYVDAPGKHVALLGVRDLVVVETPDALLVCPRSEAQNVPAVTERLRAAGRDDLL